MKRESGLPDLIAIIGIAFVVGLVLFPNFAPNRVRAPTNSCIANLKQIQGAIEQWALENKFTNTAERVTATDISGSPTNFLTGLINKDLKCPAGGTYSMTTVGEEPRCSVAGHTL